MNDFNIRDKTAFGLLSMLVRNRPEYFLVAFAKFSYKKEYLQLDPKHKFPAVILSLYFISFTIGSGSTIILSKFSGPKDIS